MQTFLPFEDYDECAKCLDSLRLRKQFVECQQIAQAILNNTRWASHPCVKMWKHHLPSLINYAQAIYKEMCNRSYEKPDHKSLVYFQTELPHLWLDQFEYLKPWFIGNVEFHISHRANLFHKNNNHYSQFGDDYLTYPFKVPGYLWPNMKTGELEYK